MPSPMGPKGWGSERTVKGWWPIGGKRGESGFSGDPRRRDGAGMRGLVPIREPDQRQREGAGAVLVRRPQGPVDVPYRLGPEGLPLVVGEAPQADAQAAFMAVVDPVMVLEAQDAVEAGDLLPHVGHG